MMIGFARAMGIMGLVGVTACGAAGVKRTPNVSSNKVGLATRVFHPKAQRDWRGAAEKDLRVMVWYPAVDTAAEVPQTTGPGGLPVFQAGRVSPHAEFAPAMEKWPLILLSHGTGGSAEQMAWLGTALARAGFIAAAVDHPGSNSNAPMTMEGFALPWERATDLSEVLDGMLADPDFGPKIDAMRVGAAGFSIGGYTVLEIAGARTDLSAFADMCRTNPHADVCHVPVAHGLGDVDQVLGAVRKTSAVSMAQSADSFRDPRVKAVFAIAPAPAAALTAESLRAMRVPVEEVVGADDSIAPAKTNADVIRAEGHGVRETVLPGVSHYTFLDTCTPAGKQAVPRFCGDAAGVDRDAVHAQVGEMAAQFFDKALKLR